MFQILSKKISRSKIARIVRLKISFTYGLFKYQNIHNFNSMQNTRFCIFIISSFKLINVDWRSGLYKRIFGDFLIVTTFLYISFLKKYFDSERYFGFNVIIMYMYVYSRKSKMKNLKFTFWEGAPSKEGINYGSNIVQNDQFELTVEWITAGLYAARNTV